MLGAEVGDVEALDPHRQLLHSQHLPERREGFDPALAPVLAPQPVLVEGEAGVALGELAQAALVAALRGPHLDRGSAPLAQRLREQPDPLAQVGADDDRPRHRRGGGVVLADELLGHLREPPLAAVVEVEALALGEDSVADLEDLGVGVGPLGRDADQVGGADRAAGDALSLEQRADRLQAVAVQRRALVLVRVGRLLHLALLLGLDLAVSAGEEVADRLDVAAVLLAVDVADARRPAALDEVVEAGIAGAPPRLGPVAGAVLEELAQQVEGLAHALGA